jgi:hypothetical protein
MIIEAPWLVNGWHGASLKWSARLHPHLQHPLDLAFVVADVHGVLKVNHVREGRQVHVRHPHQHLLHAMTTHDGVRGREGGREGGIIRVKIMGLIIIRTD